MRGSRTLRAVGTDTASNRYRVPAERAARRRVERRGLLRTRSSWYRHPAPDPQIQTLTPCSASFDMPVPLPERTHVATTPLGLGFCTRCLGPLRSACTVQSTDTSPSTPVHSYTVAHTEHGGLGHRAHASPACPNKRSD